MWHWAGGGCAEFPGCPRYRGGPGVPAGPPDPESAAEDRRDQPPHTPASAAQAAVALPAGVVIRPMGPGDAGQVLAVYQAGLDTGLASFETTAPGWEAF